MCHSAVQTLGWAYFHIKFANKSGVLPIELHPFWYHYLNSAVFLLNNPACSDLEEAGEVSLSKKSLS